MSVESGRLSCVCLLVQLYSAALRPGHTLLALGKQQLDEEGSLLGDWETVSLSCLWRVLESEQGHETCLTHPFRCHSDTAPFRERPCVTDVGDVGFPIHKRK